MRIRALRVKSVGRFATGVSIEEFSGGLDVLAAPNEAGKSTLFRALRTVLTVSHASKGAQIEALKPYGGGSPTVEVDFEINNARHRLRKQYLSGNRAELQQLGSTRAPLINRDAENALADHLGGDSAAWLTELLFVTQGAVSGEAFDMVLDANTVSIEAVVARALDTANQDGMLGAILGAVEGFLKPLATDKKLNPKKGGAWAVSVADERVAHARVANAEAALFDLEQRLNALRDLRAKLSALDSTETTQNLARARETAAEQLAAALRAGQRVRELEPRLQLVEREAQAAKAEADGYARDVRAWEALEQGLALHEATRTTAVEQTTVLRLARDQAARDLHAADARVQNLEIDVIEARARDEQRTNLARLIELTAGLDRVAALEAEIAQKRAARAKIALRQADVQKLKQLDHARVTLIARLDASNAQTAPTIEIVPEQGATRAFEVEGVPIRTPRTMTSQKPLTINVPGVGTITVRGAVSEGVVALERSKDAAEAALSVALAEAGVPSLAAAEAQMAEALDMDAAMASLNARLHAEAPRGRADLVATRDALQSKTREAKPTTHESLRTVSEIENELVQARAAARASRDALTKAELDVRAVEETLREARRLIESDQQRRAVLLGLLGPVALREAELLRRRDVAAVKTEAAIELRRTLDSWRQQSGAPEQIAGLESSVQRATEAVATRDRERAATREAIKASEGAIDALSVNDPAADLAEARIQLDRARKTQWAIERDVRALDLIRRTAETITAERRSTVLSPLLKRVEQNLRQLFATPSALDVAQGLGQTALRRNDHSEPMERLSFGTQDQIALLVRFGLAEILADQGTAHPLVLDDALVHADPSRLKAILQELSGRKGHHQTIVFTCRDDPALQHIGHRLTLAPWQ